MAVFKFKRIVSGEEIKGIIQKELGSTFGVEVRKNRIEVMQDACRGCLFLFQEKDGQTISSRPVGYMPSGGLRAAIVFGATALFLLTYFLGKNTFVRITGAIPMIFASLLMRLPSRGLVKRVAGILEKATGKA
ncbi:MAG: hypothetical protein MUO42_07595 [Anaerolineaceae bacterium]|nr:hypothetical protein [Anaerolineaceae bacterium]